ncbi:hypothetical protein [Alicycliphilus denitrificans]|jgi:hypothetical protein|uniref:hypothetical protein n=1 Tax=Alicycliphilus denitrificans TaxID=179636 RepID=UPI0016024027|nr:hypothetical protein [Alicycliphilus denitrificans]
MTPTQPRPGLIQHQLRPEVHAWIKEEARKQERSQRWFVNKLVEDAYARAQQPQGVQA